MPFPRLLAWLWAVVIGVGALGLPAMAAPAPKPAPAPSARAAAKPSAKPVPKPATKPVEPTKPKPQTPVEKAQALYQAGAQAYARGKMLEAADAFQQAVTLRPQWPDAFYYLGLTYYSLGQYDLALAAFTEAQTQYKTPNAEALYGVGLAQYALQQFAPARDAFKAVLAAKPQGELKATAQNWVKVLEGELDRQAIEKALATDTTFRQALEQYEQGQFMAAAQSLKQTLTHYPRSSMVQYYLGACNYQMTRYTEAISAFQKVIQLEPSSQYAKDAQLFIDSIRSLQQSRAGRPFSFFASLGSGYDSNVSYGTGAQVLPDATSQVNLGASYRLNPNLQAQYNLGANTNFGVIPSSSGYSSSAFNLVSHTGGLLWDWPISRLLSVGGDYQFSWYFLGGQSYLVDHRLQPRLQLAWSPNVVSRAYALVQSSQFPSFSERSSINGGVGVSTVWQLPFAPGVMLTGGYDVLDVNASDNAINERFARLDDGTQYALRSRLAASYVGHGPYLGLDWQLWQTTLRLTGRMQWLGYTKPDYYQLTYFQGDQALPPSLDTAKLRSDRLMSLTAEVIQPLMPNVYLSLQASYYLNDSNITATDYLDRSFRKGLLLANVQYIY